MCAMHAAAGGFQAPRYVTIRLEQQRRDATGCGGFGDLVQTVVAEFRGAGCGESIGERGEPLPVHRLHDLPGALAKRVDRQRLGVDVDARGKQLSIAAYRAEQRVVLGQAARMSGSLDGFE